MVIALRLDPEQRFTCASCSRCCRRWEILVSPGEVEVLRKRDAAQWFREALASPEGAAADPFEPIAGWRGYQRIRKRADGACGFLSENNRCRLHEELGAHRKPLTCRMFPYQFHPATNAVIVTTSFGCPTVVANQGERIAVGAAFEGLKALRTEWFAQNRAEARPRHFIAGRIIEAGSLAVLRTGLLAILNRSDGGHGRDLRLNVSRMAALLDDLARRRVTRLSDADFAEYLRLTVPYAAATDTDVPLQGPGLVGRLLQRGFLFVVAATRLKLDHPTMPRLTLRLRTFWLLAHVHGLAPPVDRVNVSALKGQHLDVNAPEILPIAYHYLRASLELLGANERAVLDDVAVTVSYLNAACSLAVMNGTTRTFTDALMEAVDLSHSDDRGWLGRMLSRLAGGTDALRVFARA